jgi:hypothetical protein
MGEFSLYTTVRPFGTIKGESPNRLPVHQPPPPVQEEADEQHLIKITGGQASVVQLDASFSSDVSKQSHKETQRTYDEVRIKNPDKPEQYVDVKRPTEIKSSPTAANVPYGGTSEKIKYAPQEETSSVEILEKGLTEKNPEADDAGKG